MAQFPRNCTLFMHAKCTFQLTPISVKHEKWSWVCKVAERSFRLWACPISFLTTSSFFPAQDLHAVLDSLPIPKIGAQSCIRSVDSQHTHHTSPRARQSGRCLASKVPYFSCRDFQKSCSSWKYKGQLNCSMREREREKRVKYSFFSNAEAIW